jgi:hypothetical protein
LTLRRTQVLQPPIPQPRKRTSARTSTESVKDNQLRFISTLVAKEDTFNSKVQYNCLMNIHPLFKNQYTIFTYLVLKARVYSDCDQLWVLDGLGSSRVFPYLEELPK